MSRSAAARMRMSAARCPKKADDLESIHVVYEGITRLAAQELNGLKTELRMKVRKRVGEV